MNDEKLNLYLEKYTPHEKKKFKNMYKKILPTIKKNENEEFVFFIIGRLKRNVVMPLMYEYLRIYKEFFSGFILHKLTKKEIEIIFKKIIENKKNKTVTHKRKWRFIKTILFVSGVEHNLDDFLFDNKPKKTNISKNYSIKENEETEKIKKFTTEEEYKAFTNVRECILRLSKHRGELLTKVINADRKRKFSRVEKLKNYEKARAFTEEQVNLIMKNVSNKKYYLGFMFQIKMGLRIGEVSTIRKTEITERGGNLYLLIQNHKAQRQEERTVPLSLQQDLKEYLEIYEERLQTEEYLFFSDFANYRRTHISEHSFRNYLYKLLIELNIVEYYGTSSEQGRKERKLNLYSTHSFRHYFANKLYQEAQRSNRNETIKIEMVRMGLRHSRADTTLTYLRQDLEHLNDIMRIM